MSRGGKLSGAARGAGVLARTAAGVALAAAIGITAPGAQAADAAAAGVPASWQKHQYSFQYMGFTSTYSCDGLADKLKKILLAAGARPDVKSEPGACASGFGRPDKFARADLTFFTLAPAAGATAAGATAAGAAAASAAAASAAAGGGAASSDSGAVVMGTWRPITLTARSPRDLAVGDCELIEQFRTQVLPLFTTRDRVNHTTCVPHQESGSVIDLAFDALVAPPVGPPR